MIFVFVVIEADAVLRTRGDSIRKKLPRSPAHMFFSWRGLSRMILGRPPLSWEGRGAHFARDFRRDFDNIPERY